MSDQSELLPVSQEALNVANFCIPSAVVFADTAEHVADLRQRAAQRIARFERDTIARHRLSGEGDAAYWRGRYEGFIEALRKTHTPEQLAEMGII